MSENKLVKAKDAYIDYILRVDKKVEWNKDGRPLFAVENNDKTYYIPLSSQFAENEAEGIGCLLIRDKENNPIGRLLIKNAVLIPETELEEYQTNDSTVKTELDWLEKNKATILDNLKATMRWKSTHYDLSPEDESSVRNCVDFIKNEGALHVYNLRGKIPPKDTNIDDYILSLFSTKKVNQSHESALNNNVLHNFANMYTLLLNTTDEKDTQEITEAVQEKPHEEKQLTVQKPTQETTQRQPQNKKNSSPKEKPQTPKKDKAEVLTDKLNQANEAVRNTHNAICENIVSLRNHMLFEEAVSVLHTLNFNSLNMSMIISSAINDNKITLKDANKKLNEYNCIKKIDFCNNQIKKIINASKQSYNTSQNNDKYEADELINNIFNRLNSKTLACMDKSNSYYNMLGDSCVYRVFTGTHEIIDELKKSLYKVDRSTDLNTLKLTLLKLNIFKSLTTDVRESFIRSDITLEAFKESIDLLKKYEKDLQTFNSKANHSEAANKIREKIKDTHKMAEKGIKRFINVFCNRINNGNEYYSNFFPKLSFHQAYLTDLQNQLSNVQKSFDGYSAYLSIASSTFCPPIVKNTDDKPTDVPSATRPVYNNVAGSVPPGTIPKATTSKNNTDIKKITPKKGNVKVAKPK
ncbi:MAG: type III toxin-antitoxin system ToxN/AbiQ family toxin [Pseudobutyrivibrio sp.]|nr:type III toxin-antitoxin system ToxN/AbiQ family toxin [Pseudobutyrivibrio sp.]